MFIDPLMKDMRFIIFKIFDGHLFFYAEGEDAPPEDDEGEWPPMELREFRTMIEDREYLWCKR